MILIAHNDPLRMFLAWFRDTYVSDLPDIEIKFTRFPKRQKIVGACIWNPADNRWNLFVDVTSRYDAICEAVMHELSHILYKERCPESKTNSHGPKWKATYKEIKEGWERHAEKEATKSAKVLIRARKG